MSRPVVGEIGLGIVFEAAYICGALILAAFVLLIISLLKKEYWNIKEAIFRFKITKKFWPQNYEAYYELIYCLLLEGEFESAQKVIDDLLEKSPDYKERIDQLLSPEEPDSEAEVESEEV